MELLCLIDIFKCDRLETDLVKVMKKRLLNRGQNESCKKALFNFACFVNVLAISLEN